MVVIRPSYAASSLVRSGTRLQLRSAGSGTARCDSRCTLALPLGSRGGPRTSGASNTSPEAHGGVPNGPGAPTHSDRVKEPFSYFCVDARSWRESTKRNGKVR